MSPTGYHPLGPDPEQNPPTTSQVALEFDDPRHLIALVGPGHQFLARLEQRLDLRISDRGNTLLLEGDVEATRRGEHVLTALYDEVARGHTPTLEEVDAHLRFALQDQTRTDSSETLVRRGASGAPRSFRAKSPGQEAYRAAMMAHDLVFALGPAGTGKTFLAILAAVEALQNEQVQRLVLARPAVEAGERIGFLPGDMQEKLDPYMQPLYDALDETLGQRRRISLMDKEKGAQIELIPLAFMRGRTFKDAFIILDEAQNATPAQMKMVLTRLGPGSRMVVTGDPSQVDLPRGTPSGLVEAVERLGGIDGIAAVRLEARDVVRHELVARIIEAYDLA